MHLAFSLGVRVHVAHLNDDPDLLGFYNHERRQIVLRMGLTPFEMRSVLAHEIGHAYYGDECSSGSSERRAEKFAAEVLIDPAQYATAEQTCTNSYELADELRVTVEVVETFQRECLQRLGGVTYGRSWRTGISPALARRLSI